jgi:predicted nucleic acid-binding protein
MIIVDASVAVKWVVSEAGSGPRRRAARVDPVARVAAGRMRMALELEHPIYDCFYLSAAMQKDTHVVTADRRFVAKVAAHPTLADRVKLLGA